jgi:tetratricopeptide (TPR) repeat protein
MSDLLVGALSIFLATNSPAALSNYVVGKVGVNPSILVSSPDAADPRYAELRKVMEADDAADEEIGRWVSERRAADPTDPRTESELAFRRRVEARNEAVKEQYVQLIGHHPQYVPALNAYASFLAESGDEEGAIVQLEKASEINPKDPAVWNNLANFYGHIGPIHRAFPAFEKAIELNPYEPIYRYNLATVVFLFRKDSMEYYRCDEQAVFNKALDMYREVRRLRPHNFRYAFDFAQTFYGVKAAPADTADGRRQSDLKLAAVARGAWLDALALADNELDRNGIFLHLARWNIRTGEFESARTNLTLVTHDEHLEMRKRLERSIAEKIASKDKGSNGP